MKNIMVFHLHKKEDLAFSAYHSIGLIHCCYEGHILFQNKKRAFIIGNTSIIEAAKRLRFLCEKALSNQLCLHESIKNNIGLLENEYNNVFWEETYSTVTRTFIKEGSSWIGNRYSLWGAKNKATWLYNDQYGNIILEITPWFHSSYRNRFEKLPFAQWIKSYKPILKRIIPKETAKQWIVQADKLINIIEQNIEHMKNEHEDKIQ